MTRRPIRLSSSTRALAAGVLGASLVVGPVQGVAGAGTFPAAAPTQPVAASSTSLPATPAGASETCPSGWTVAPKTSSPMTAATIRGVRTGRHACFDRLVIDIKGSRQTAGYHVDYVGQVTQDGSGRVVPLRGAAKLMVVVRAPSYDQRGRSTYRPRNLSEVVDTSAHRTFRQVAWAGSFEGQTTFGIGLRAKLPYRVFTLRTGTNQMLIIDVAHNVS